MKVELDATVDSLANFEVFITDDAGRCVRVHGFQVIREIQALAVAHGLMHVSAPQKVEVVVRHD